MWKEILILKYDIPDKIKVNIRWKLKSVDIKISTNKIYSWIHWTIRNKIAEWYHNLTKQDCMNLKSIEKKINLKMDFYFKSYALDSSNCSFMWKMIEDSLVKNWLIKDDTNKFVWEFNIESVELSEKERKKLESHYVRIYIYKY